MKSFCSGSLFQFVMFVTVLLVARFCHAGFDVHRTWLLVPVYLTRLLAKLVVRCSFGTPTFLERIRAVAKVRHVKLLMRRNPKARDYEDEKLKIRS